MEEFAPRESKFLSLRLVSKLQPRKYFQEIVPKLQRGSYFQANGYPVRVSVSFHLAASKPAPKIPSRLMDTVSQTLSNHVTLVYSIVIK